MLENRGYIQTISFLNLFINKVQNIMLYRYSFVIYITFLFK